MGAPKDEVTAARQRDGLKEPGAAEQAVGRVLGTEAATPLQFWVALEPASYLQLDDVVVTARQVPGVGSVTTAGVVTAVHARHEGAQFPSDVFLIEEGVLPGEVQETAEITTTRVEPECYVPPKPGAVAQRATGAQRAQALYFDQMDHRVPIGLGRDGSPIYVDLEFIDGTRGAHVSISGVSGVATKTSFALFLLYSIFRSGVLDRRALNAKALVFSVKGEDLLFLDHANNRLDDEVRDRYGRLGLRAEPFSSVGFYAPPTPEDTTGRPNVVSRTSGVTAFWWTPVEFCREELLPYVFADAEDERHQYTMVVHQVATRLRLDAALVGADGAVGIDGMTVRTYDDLVDLVVAKVSDDQTRVAWAGQATGLGTVNAFVRRLRSSLRALRPIIRADIPQAMGRRISTEDQQVTVVDLHNLPERAQRFVVGVVLAHETERKEQAGPGGLLFTMIDELNKYAPREGTSPIKEAVLDIAERGRSLGIILIGAQQTASEVERRVIANSSIRVVGRLDSAEAARPEYRFLPASQRARATLAKPGTMFVSQPEVPVPLAVEFPFPAWATRPSGCGEVPHTSPLPGEESHAEPTDPFARLPRPTDDVPRL
ncbi:ATP-binding protein [Streptomyces sp. ISL-98]|uniref:ATP-binding protein n=1 Tax=Streptomyces sp. ISL-98 TaxID=2819192 RepID=UPI001BE65E81|nr:ATP-binding protein [Streptomyces sp. ISL-98]MBT2509815.1 ATP-binding protein [Streptomyces sp. ISL-98]